MSSAADKWTRPEVRIGSGDMKITGDLNKSNLKGRGGASI